MKFKKLAIGLTVVSIVNSSTPAIKVFADELKNTDTQVKTIAKENNKTEEKISNMKKFMTESHKNFEKYKEVFKIPNELILELSS